MTEDEEADEIIRRLKGEFYTGRIVDGWFVLPVAKPGYTITISNNSLTSINVVSNGTGYIGPSVVDPGQEITYKESP